MRKFYQVCALVVTTLSINSFAGEKVDKTLSLNDATNVSVDNLRGKVKITGWDKDAVSVEGELDDKAEQFIFEQYGSTIKIKVVMPRHLNSGWNEEGSDLTIHVPEQVKVNFNGVSTDITLANLNKGTEVKTVSGNVNAKSLSQYIELVTVSGDIDSRDISGKITMSTVSGDIEDKNSQGRLKVKTVSGNLRTQSTANEIYINTVSGEMDLALGNVDELTIATVSGDVDGSLSLDENGLIKMSSVSGDMDIAFENDVQASFRFKSNAGGDLVNRITSDKAKHAKYGPSSKLYFETGKASASVKASTVSGTIKVSTK